MKDIVFEDRHPDRNHSVPAVAQVMVVVKVLAIVAMHAHASTKLVSGQPLSPQQIREKDLYMTPSGPTRFQVDGVKVKR